MLYIFLVFFLYYRKLGTQDKCYFMILNIFHLFMWQNKQTQKTFWVVLNRQLKEKKGTARYAGLLPALAEGFGQDLFCLWGFYAISIVMLVTLREKYINLSNLEKNSNTSKKEKLTKFCIREPLNPSTCVYGRTDTINQKKIEKKKIKNKNKK